MVLPGAGVVGELHSLTPPRASPSPFLSPVSPLTQILISRKLHHEYCVFDGIHYNVMFCAIWIACTTVLKWFVMETFAVMLNCIF